MQPVAQYHNLDQAQNQQRSRARSDRPYFTLHLMLREPLAAGRQCPAACAVHKVRGDRRGAHAGQRQSAAGCGSPSLRERPALRQDRAASQHFRLPTFPAGSRLAKPCRSDVPLWRSAAHCWWWRSMMTIYITGRLIPWAWPQRCSVDAATEASEHCSGPVPYPPRPPGLTAVNSSGTLLVSGSEPSQKLNGSPGYRFCAAVCCPLSVVHCLLPAVIKLTSIFPAQRFDSRFQASQG